MAASSTADIRATASAQSPTAAIISHASVANEGYAEHLRIDVANQIADLSRARSLIEAFKLAATADSYEKPAIYWPDLMEMLASALPTPEGLQSNLSRLFEMLEACQAREGAGSA